MTSDLTDSPDLMVPISEPFLKYSVPLSIQDSYKERDRDSLDHVLDAMFEPRQWETLDEVHMIQRVSRIPVNRLDVMALENTLNECLQRYQAQDKGICPIRRTLYDRSFDELIRQVTINCMDQGLFMYKIRNEFRMTLDAYRSLYESSISFGLRYVLRSHQDSEQINLQRDDILHEKESLAKRLDLLQKTHSFTLEKHEETMKVIITKYEEELRKLRLVIKKQERLIEVLNRKPIQL